MPCKQITLPNNYIEAWSKEKELKENPMEIVEGKPEAPKMRRRSKKMLMEQRSLEVMKEFSMNYLCVKKVLEYCDWRDLNILSEVCELWKEAATSVAKGKLSPSLFSLHDSKEKMKVGSVTYRCSGSLQLEPMFIISFLNQKAAQKQFKCKDFQNPPCKKKCSNTHKYLDFIYSKLCYPRSCLVGIKCPAVVFHPAQSVPGDCFCDVRPYDMNAADLSFLAGFAVPKIPGVNFYEETFCLNNNEDTIYHYYHYINNILDKELVKCVMLFPSEVCHKSNHIQLGLAINYLFGRQEINSFAIGGSVVKAVATEHFHKTQMTNCRQPDLLVLVLSVPRRVLEKDNPPEFDVGSLVLREHSSNVAEIREKIQEFASIVPKHRYSTAVQFVDVDCRFMGCCECDCASPKSGDAYTTEFCSIFPRITLTGCYGEAQLGAAHPPPKQKLPAKYTNYEDRFLFDIHCCVFLYFTWGT